MSLTLIGRKRGMTRIFYKKTGKVVPCTIIEVEPNVVMQVKTKESDGYTAIRLAAFSLSSSQKGRMNKPDLGQFTAKNIDPKSSIKESRLDDVASYEVGQNLHIDLFAEGSFVDVQGRSKGRGYQGPVRRFGVKCLPRSHGVGPVVRHLGSTGWVRGHGRIQKNKKMAGHMGDENVTVEMLEVVKVDTNLNALVVKGSIPGANGRSVYVRQSIKQ